MGLLPWCHCTRIFKPRVIYDVFEETTKRNEFLFLEPICLVHLDPPYCEQTDDEGIMTLVTRQPLCSRLPDFCLPSKYLSSLRFDAVQVLSLYFFHRRWTARKRWHEHTIVQFASRARVFKRIVARGSSHLDVTAEMAVDDGRVTQPSRVEIVFDTMTDERSRPETMGSGPPAGLSRDSEAELPGAIHFRRYTRPAGIEIEDGALRTNKDINQRMTFRPRHGGQTNELEAKDSIAHLAIEGLEFSGVYIKDVRLALSSFGPLMASVFSRRGVNGLAQCDLSISWWCRHVAVLGQICNPVDSDGFDNMSNPLVQAHLFEGCHTHFDDVGVDLSSGVIVKSAFFACELLATSSFKPGSLGIIRGFRDSLTADFVGTGFDEATGGLGGGLTGLCRVLGILGVTEAAVEGFCEFMVVIPLAAERLVVLPDKTVTEVTGGFVSFPSDNFLFLVVPCSDTATA
ncbi:hypothetical protein KCU83_g407, partial [Aureobasidium melanogenum]